MTYSYIFQIVACSFLIIQLTSCHHGSWRRCDAPTHTNWPEKLSETGLYKNIKDDQLHEGVKYYEPQFELWSDGATKRRWAYFPSNKQIDSSNPDEWKFPEGTKFWKEFTKDGTRVETRLLSKVGPRDHDWLAVSYVWNQEQTEAFATKDAVNDVLNTTHDVPSARQCTGCHGGRQSRILGFSAIQLGNQKPLSLDMLRRDNLISHPIQDFSIPGDSDTQQVLGYLHANCAHCHNLTRPKQEGKRCFDPRKNFDLSLRTSEIDHLHTTALYKTAVGPNKVIRAGSAAMSRIHKRMLGSSMFRPRMPALATEEIDIQKLRQLRDWINKLPTKK